MERELPEVGSLEIARVKKITRYGAYVELLERGIEGFLHISEISTRLVRRVEDVLRPGQIIVVKVIKVRRVTDEVDVSLKRVLPSESKSKLVEWKRNEHGRAMIEEFARRVDADPELITSRLLDFTGPVATLFDAIEEAVAAKDEFLEEKPLGEGLSEEFISFFEGRIKPPTYEGRLLLEVRSLARDGVSAVKSFFEAMSAAFARRGLSFKAITQGAPRYLVLVTGDKPKALSKTIERLSEALPELGKEQNCIVRVVKIECCRKL